MPSKPKNNIKRDKENINSLDINGSTYLHNIVNDNKNVGLIKKAIFLLGSNIDTLNKNKFPPLHIAIKQGNIDAIETLIDCGASLYLTIDSDKKFNAICSAVYYGDEEVLDLIIKKGGGIHINKSGFTPNAYESLPALHLAITADYYNLIKKLISTGAFIEETYGFKKLTALQRASNKQWSKAVTPLFKAGADLNIANIETGDTALHIAAELNHYKPLQDLIASGAELNVVNNKGYTPLMEAVLANNKAVIEALLEAGADQNITDDRSERKTALHLAVMSAADSKVIYSLLDKKPNILAIDKNNKTASQYMSEYIRGKINSPFYYSHREVSKYVAEALRKAENKAKAMFFQRAANKANRVNKKFKM